MGTKRIYSLDFVKLVAIYLVLWGHCIQSLIPEVGSGEGKILAVLICCIVLVRLFLRSKLTSFIL